jgi:hypothetical protein
MRDGQKRRNQLPLWCPLRQPLGFVLRNEGTDRRALEQHRRSVPGALTVGAISVDKRDSGGLRSEAPFLCGENPRKLGAYHKNDRRLPPASAAPALLLQRVTSACDASAR